MEKLLEFDSQLFVLFNTELTNTFFDKAMPILTDLHRHGLWSLLLLGLTLGLWVLKKRKSAIIPIITLALGILVSESTSHRLLKPTFERKRPEFQESVISLKTHRHSGYSFPSTHSTNGFTAATILSLYYPHLKLVYFTVASVLAYSRVYVGVHYPFDIAFGALVGTILGLLIFYTFRKIRSKSFKSI